MLLCDGKHIGRYIQPTKLYTSSLQKAILIHRISYTFAQLSWRGRYSALLISFDIKTRPSELHTKAPRKNTPQGQALFQEIPPNPCTTASNTHLYSTTCKQLSIATPRIMIKPQESREAKNHLTYLLGDSQNTAWLQLPVTLRKNKRLSC